MGKVVLIDFMWMVYRSYYAFKDLTVPGLGGREVSTGIYFGMTRLVQSIPGEFLIIFCKDGFPEEKYKLYKDYKGNRSVESPFGDVSFTDLEGILCGDNRVHFSFDNKREADEIMADLALRYKGMGNDVIIYSGDDDLLQMIPFGIKISRKIERGNFVLYNAFEILKKYGVEPEHLILYRALVGDKSDNIPPVIRRLNRVYVREFVKLWHEEKSLKRVFPLISSRYPEISRKLVGVLPDLVRNYKLMVLRKLEGERKIYRVPFSRGLLEKYKLKSFGEFLNENKAGIGTGSSN